jgi:hypothetical protein
MVLAARYEHLNFVVQDREVVVDMGKKVRLSGFLYLAAFLIAFDLHRLGMGDVPKYWIQDE